MNDNTSRITQNPWFSPVQQSTCPNCPQPAAAAPSAMFPFSTTQTVPAPSQTTIPQSPMIQQTFPSTTPQKMSIFPSTRQGDFLSPSTLMPPSTSNIGNIGMMPQTATAAPEAPAAPVLPGLTAINLFDQPGAMTLESLQYLNGFMVTQIGRQVSVEFLIGTSTMVTKNGMLVGVGANYILIHEFASDDIIACDFYSIKFIKFYY